MLVKRWASFDGTERAEAQTFVNELFAAYGSDRKEIGALFEDSHSADGIMDLYWRDVCIIEMKAPKQTEQLTKHRKQALDYWDSSSDVASNRPAPPYVVLCSFQRFEIWEPGKFHSEPRLTINLDDLPDRYEALLFLTGPSQKPTFIATPRKLTTEASATVVSLYESLRDRQAGEQNSLRDFCLQLVWCLFAESLGMITGHPVEQIVSDSQVAPGNSGGLFNQLFSVLNEPEDYNRQGIFAGAPYTNGGLFAIPARVTLNLDELQLVARAAAFDWRQVDPTIFGSLMEGCLGREQRWTLGAHYTHESDIMKIVRPTIIDPWQERINSCSFPDQAVALLDELAAFTVLDPACGCGNFLYVAYRELRALEYSLKAKIAHLARQLGLPQPTHTLPFFPIGNVLGMEIDLFAVHISRVTLWMGHRLMAERYGWAEPPLPLVDLAGIRHCNALWTSWPPVEAIIGNPPFNGAQHLRKDLGAAEVDRIKAHFGVGVKDYCVYWFRKASERLAVGQRAGLVGTNSISQNRARTASLDYVLARGGVITDAISTQKWPGEAKVHVSIVNWVQKPEEVPPRRTLDGRPVEGIGADLRTPRRSALTAGVLKANGGKCFQGPIPVGKGFVLMPDEAEMLLNRTDNDYSLVVKRRLMGEDVTDNIDQGPSTWVIDFASMSLEVAMTWPAALSIVRSRVKPERDMNSDAGFREFWWRFGRPRLEMRRAIADLPRSVGIIAYGKRLCVTWIPAGVVPSNKINVVALSEDWQLGVLASGVHEPWARARGATLKSDLSYTPTSVFSTFPWPTPSSPQRHLIAEVPGIS